LFIQGDCIEELGFCVCFQGRYGPGCDQRMLF